MIEDISAQLDRHKLHFDLDEGNKLYTLCCNTSFLCCSIPPNKRYRYYTIILFIITVIVLVNDNLIVEILLNVAYTIILSSIFLECNKIIVQNGFLNFKVCYVIFNTIVAMTSLRILNNFQEDRYHCSNNTSYPLIACKIDSYISTILNAFTLLLASLMDGYLIKQKYKILLISIAIFYYVYIYIFISITYNSNTNNNNTNTNNTNNSDSDPMIKLFGQNYRNVHSLALSASMNVIIFIMRQAYYLIKKPTKLILISAKVKFVHSESNQFLAQLANNNDHDNINIRNQNADTAMSIPAVSAVSSISSVDLTDDRDKIIQVKIDRHKTIFYTLLTKMATLNCTNMNEEKAIQWSKILNSTKCWLIGLILIIIVYIIAVFVRIITPLYMIILFINLFIFILLFGCNLNFAIFKYSVKSSFVFWWKLQDSVSLLFIELLIDYHNNKGNFGSKLNTMGESIVISIVDISTVLIGMTCIALSHAVFIKLKFKTLFLLFGILFWFQKLLKYFFSSDDFEITFFQNSDVTFVVSCRIIVISKSIDLIIWFVVQLVNMIRLKHAINVSGKVTCKWVTQSESNVRDSGFVLLNDMSASVQ